MATHGYPCSHVIFAWQVCALRIAAMLHTHGRKSAGAHVLDRQDQTWVDDDDDDDDDDYNDKRVMVDDAPLRYTRLTAKQGR